MLNNEPRRPLWNAGSVLLLIGILVSVVGGLAAFSGSSKERGMAMPIVALAATFMISGALLDLADAIRERRS